MNLDEMKRMMNLMENMNGKSPMDIISQNNPRLAQMQNFYSNPTEILSKMGGIENLGDFNGRNGIDITTMVNMMGNMKKASPNQRSNITYHGLAPIAGFATPEIVYELNRYLSEGQRADR